MSNLAAQTEELKREQRNLRSQFESLANEIDGIRSIFFGIERKCFSTENHHCIAVHDNFKLEIAQTQRLGDREKMYCYENCTSIIPEEMMPRDIENWDLNSPEDVEVFKKYFACFKPYMYRYMEYMKQEKGIFERANKKMSELVYH